MVHQLSTGVLEVLRDVLAVLFIKITLCERQRVCDFMNDLNRQVISLVLPDSEAC